MEHFNDETVHDILKLKNRFEVLVKEEQRHHEESILYHKHMVDNFDKLAKAIDQMFIDIGYKPNNKEEDKDANL